jgi:hypothetical protein
VLNQDGTLGLTSNKADVLYERKMTPNANSEHSNEKNENSDKQTNTILKINPHKKPNGTAKSISTEEEKHSSTKENADKMEGDEALS